MTKAEIKLWSVLKNRNLSRTKFRRQHGIGDYIVDFYCPELKIAIEVNGESHYTKSGIKHDRKRNQFLKELDIKALHFTNEQVFNNLDGVLLTIENILIELND